LTQHQSFREEFRDASGRVKGKFGFIDPQGILWITEYTADKLGYRNTNNKCAYDCQIVNHTLTYKACKYVLQSTELLVDKPLVLLPSYLRPNSFIEPYCYEHNHNSQMLRPSKKFPEKFMCLYFVQ
ncbi:hypothetical protein Cfor_01277, partial [Coptotermes formosanus]